MEKLLRLTANQRWDLTGIQFVIPERVSAPEDFIRRVMEMEFLYRWARMIPRGMSRSSAFLGRRKVGKGLMLERLYNIRYSEHAGIVPFYYEFREGQRDGKDFYRDFVIRFYMQLVSGFHITDFTFMLNYHLPTGTEVDVVLVGASAGIIAECKSRAEPDPLTPAMLDEFMDQARQLHHERYPDKELRCAFFSKHGVEEAFAQYATVQGVQLTLDPAALSHHSM